MPSVRWLLVHGWNRGDAITNILHLGEPCEVGMSGFTVETDENDCKAMKVGSVAGDGPASEAGLRAGDVITAIDGRPMESISSNEFERLFRQHGKELNLTVKRSEGVVQRKII